MTTPFPPAPARRHLRSPARTGLRAGLRAVLPLGLAGLLAACTTAALPDFTQSAPASPGVGAEQERAIAACLGRAEAQGLSVAGVSNASEIIGSGGQPAGQNVFLDVSRGGQTFNVRCSYTYASAQARIMTL